MKKFFLISIVGAIMPVTVFAQQLSMQVPNDNYAFASVFASNFSLLLSIVIGIIATSLVFRAAQKMGGGLFGIVLNYMSLGMLLVILGTLSSVAGSWFGGLWISILSMALFAGGYIFMVLGANKLLKGLLNT